MSSATAVAIILGLVGQHRSVDAVTDGPDAVSHLEVTIHGLQ
jgi:hypothetical protein